MISAFRRLRAYRQADTSMLTYAHMCARKVGLSLLHVATIVGIWPSFEVFVPTYLTICHEDTYTRLQGKLCCLYAYDMVSL